MQRFRGRARALAATVAVVAAASVVAACGRGEPIAADAFTDRAQQVIDAWNGSAVETAWRTGFVPLADLTYIDHSGGSIYRSDDGTQQVAAKQAIMAGAYRLDAPRLPAIEGMRDIRFPDGTSMSVPLLTASDAFRQLRRSEPDPTCSGPGCVLTVTAARLAEMTLATSRGQATVPAWAFTIAELTVPVLYVAVVPSAITPPPEPAIEPEPRLTEVGGVTADGVSAAEARRLKVHYGTGACVESYRALAYESTSVVVVGAEAVDSGGICTSQLVLRSSYVDLGEPLGDRVLLDAASGRPIVLSTCEVWQVVGC